MLKKLCSVALVVFSVAGCVSGPSSPGLSADQHFERALEAMAEPGADSGLTSLRSAANDGHPVASRLLADRYLAGEGVMHSPAIAWGWFEQAAEAGDTEAMYRLGEMARRGWGKPKDVEVASAWYQRAADQGHEPSAWELARLQLKQPEARRDYAQIRSLLEVAAAEFNPDAWHDLATTYEHGLGGEQQLNEASQFYEKAAKAGHGFSMVRLALIHKHDRIASADPALAYVWLVRAARTVGPARIKDYQAIEAEWRQGLTVSQLDWAKEQLGGKLPASTESGAK